MQRLRTMIGAIAGGAVAGAGLRIAQLARERHVPVTDVLADLPQVARTERERIAVAARGAMADGRAAARQREHELEQVLEAARRRGSHDD